MLHEIDCPFPSFPHVNACTCKGGWVRSLLDRGKRGTYDPEKGFLAELVALSFRIQQGYRAALTRDLYAKFKNPGLANSTIGDILLIDRMGGMFSDEVKEITAVAERTGNVLVSRYSLDRGAFDRILAVEPEERLVYEVDTRTLKGSELELYSHEGQDLYFVPFMARGRCLRADD